MKFYPMSLLYKATFNYSVGANIALKTPPLHCIVKLLHVLMVNDMIMHKQSQFL